MLNVGLDDQGKTLGGQGNLFDWCKIQCLSELQGEITFTFVYNTAIFHCCS